MRIAAKTGRQMKMKMNKKTKTLQNGRLAEEQDLCGVALSSLTRLEAAVLFVTRLLALGVAGAALTMGAPAQNPAASATGEQKPNCDNQIRSTYLLGPDDQLEISGPEL